MSVVLLDVNLLIPLVWVKHVHHSAARRWFCPSQRTTSNHPPVP
jgi:predicted nucleic acid-binding protein